MDTTNTRPSSADPWDLPEPEPIRIPGYPHPAWDDSDPEDESGEDESPTTADPDSRASNPYEPVPDPGPVRLPNIAPVEPSEGPSHGDRERGDEEPSERREEARAADEEPSARGRGAATGGETAEEGAGEETPSPRESSLAFLSHCEGRKGYRGRERALTEGFLKLPRFAVDAVTEEFGLVNRRGRGYGQPRVELAVLSVMTDLARESLQGSELEYGDGERMRVDEWEFVTSIWTVARRIIERFWMLPTTPDTPHQSKEVQRLYKKVSRALDRLDGLEVDGKVLLARLGPARETGHKHRDAYGQRYTMAGSALWERLQALPRCAPPPRSVSARSSSARLLPDSYYVDIGIRSPLAEPPSVEELRRAGARSLLPPLPKSAKASSSAASPVGRLLPDRTYVDIGTELVDVARIYDRLVPERCNLYKCFDEQLAKSRGFRSAERSVKGRAWQRRQAQRSRVLRSGGSRHVSVGAWREGDAKRPGRRTLPCAVPYAIWEIDSRGKGTDVEGCHAYARAITERLLELGAPSEALTITYTGNESFHVRLPTGALGLPLYRSVKEAQCVLLRFLKAVAEPLDAPEGIELDASIASPLHLIRAMGSLHEKRHERTGEERYCVGFSAEEFLQMPLMALQAHAEVYSGGHTMKLPEQVDTVPRLKALHDRETERFDSAGEYSGNRGIIARIKEGVRPGEEFAEGYVGRNLAALLLSANLLSSTDLTTQDAFQELKRWNEEKNPVPLGEHLGDERGELRGQFERAIDYVYNQ